MRRTQHRPTLLAGLLVATLLAAGIGATEAADGRVDRADRASAEPGPPLHIPSGAPTTGEDSRPNVVLITTDDQALSDLAWMPHTRQLLGAQGVTFKNGLSPHPLCCPARAQILTGQYAQNNGVRSNSGPFGGFASLREPGNTVGSWLDQTGYNTGMVGKYLNLYQESDGIQRGWDYWSPTIAQIYSAFGTTFMDNGNPRTYADTHNNDAVTEGAVAMVEKWAPEDRPFFIWSSYVAPHGRCATPNDLCASPPIPADRHANAYAGAVNPSFRKPSFNERDVSDKPFFIAGARKQSRAAMQQLFLQRIRALASVDEGVRDTVAALRDAGELDNTLVIFTTDNGYFLGEHRYKGKILPYQEAVRVPFLMRGPGIKPGASSISRVTTLDLAPTIADAAGAQPGRVVDGLSVLPIARGQQGPPKRTVLLLAGPRRSEYGTRRWSFHGAYEGRYTYVQWTNRNDFTELYDRKRDPFELVNVADKRRYRAVRKELDKRTTTLRDCSGNSCRRNFGKLPKPKRPRGR